MHTRRDTLERKKGYTLWGKKYTLGGKECYTLEGRKDIHEKVFQVQNSPSSSLN